MECKNCNTTYNDSQNFCFECGAKIIRNRLRPKVLVNQVNEEFLSVDNKLLKTFIHLFTKPELVINGYISGVRKKYINVIQYFAIGLTLLGIQVFFMENIFNDPELYKIDFLEKMSKMPNQDKNPFLNGDMNDFNSSQSLFFTLSIPISAFATWLATQLTGYRRFNFTEHIVINLYYGAQTIIISALIYIIFLGFNFNFFTIAFFVTIITYAYFFFVIKKVFKMPFWVAFGHFILMMLLTAFFFMIIFIFGTLFYFILNKELLTSTL